MRADPGPKAIRIRDQAFGGLSRPDVAAHLFDGRYQCGTTVIQLLQVGNERSSKLRLIMFGFPCEGFHGVRIGQRPPRYVPQRAECHRCRERYVTWQKTPQLGESPRPQPGTESVTVRQGLCLGAWDRTLIEPLG